MIAQRLAKHVTPQRKWLVLLFLAAYLAAGVLSVHIQADAQGRAAPQRQGRLPTAISTAAAEAQPEDGRANDNQLQGSRLTRLTIPRILHHVYIGNRPPPEDVTVMEGCRRYYSEQAGWKHVFWDQPAAEALIAELDPNFLPAYRSYPNPVQRADVVRYYIMKSQGGLYLDMDAECWREGSDFLEGHDMVLQGHHPGEAVNNGMIGSIPGHSLWNTVIELAKQRRERANDSGCVIICTGPQLLRDAYLRHFGVALDKEGHLPPVGHLSAGRGVHVHPLGTWFTPCKYDDHECKYHIKRQRENGAEDRTKLVGAHLFSFGWATFTLNQNQGSQHQAQADGA